jgi:predicted  nucleic acid-binding Zn-ribbon protein
MKEKTKGKDKDKVSCMNMKSNTIMLEERIRKQINETEALQKQYDDMQREKKKINSLHEECQRKLQRNSHIIKHEQNRLSDLNKSIDDAFRSFMTIYTRMNEKMGEPGDLKKGRQELDEASKSLKKQIGNTLAFIKSRHKEIDI